MASYRARKVQEPMNPPTRSQKAADASHEVVVASQRLVHSRHKEGLPRATEIALFDALERAVLFYEECR